jgi:iron complex outermembrane recepter protein
VTCRAARIRHSTSWALLLFLHCLLGALGVCDAADIEAQSASTLSAPIEPQPLAQALAALARQTSLQVIYESALVAGRHSGAVPAGLSVTEALDRLLRDTGLRAEFLNPRTVRLIATAGERTSNSTAQAAKGKEPRQQAHPTDVLEEVLVTAQKRQESLSAVPISAIVLSGETMELLGVKTIREIAELTPGLAFESSSAWGPGILTNLSIRGITNATTIKGSEANVGISTSGVYIDDVPLQMQQTSFASPYPITFDLARVEVLRGPQGTLFGAGAEGGAVRFIPNEPSTTDFDALYRAEVLRTEYGDFSFETAAAAGGPLIEGQLGARVSAWLSQDGGYVDRVNPFTDATVDTNANRTVSRAARLSFAFAPVPSFRVIPSFMYQSARVHDTPSFYTYLSDPTAGIFRNGKLLRQPAEDTFYDASIKVQTRLGAAELTAVASYFHRAASGTVDITNLAGITYFGTFGNPLGPAYPTSYADAGATVERSGQILTSQEVRLASVDPEARVSWLVGLFYSRARERVTEIGYLVAAPDNPGLVIDAYNIHSDIAGFANTTFNFTSRWSASLGARLTRTRGDSTEHDAGFEYPPPLLFHGVTEETPLTPRFGVAYKGSGRQLLYATLAKGFRSGGFNNRDTPPCVVVGLRPFGSDSLWSYEIGVKDTLFDQRVRFAGSVFYIKWKNIQEGVNESCGAAHTANLGAATSKGFDLTTDVHVGDRTTVNVALSFVDARYTNTAVVGGNVVVERGTAVGGATYCPSPWNATVSVEHRLPIGASLVGYAGIEDIVHSHNPGPFLESNRQSISYDPTAQADPATNLLNLHLGITRSALDLRLSVTNALNSHPILVRENDAPGSSLHYAQTFRPRTLAFTVTQRF